MNFEVTASQGTYFGKHGQISFEDLLTPEEFAYLSTLKKGYDLWRTEGELKKIVLGKNVGKLIFALTEKRPIRLLFDRICANETIDLGQVCFQGVAIGMLVSTTANLTTFFSTEKKMTVDSPHLLIVYGESNTRYIFCEADPYAPLLKKKGYAYGDRLKTEDFPYLYR